MLIVIQDHKRKLKAPESIIYVSEVKNLGALGVFLDGEELKLLLQRVNSSMIAAMNIAAELVEIRL